jgi:hypothetical protein
MAGRAYPRPPSALNSCLVVERGRREIPRRLGAASMVPPGVAEVCTSRLRLSQVPPCHAHAPSAVANQALPRWSRQPVFLLQANTSQLTANRYRRQLISAGRPVFLILFHHTRADANAQPVRRGSLAFFHPLTSSTKSTASSSSLFASHPLHDLVKPVVARVSAASGLAALVCIHSAPPRLPQRTSRLHADHSTRLENFVDTHARNGTRSTQAAPRHHLSLSSPVALVCRWLTSELGRDFFRYTRASAHSARHLKGTSL